MSDLYDFAAFYVCHVGIGIVWIAFPAFVVYPIVCRICKGKWQRLHSCFDLCSLLAMHAIWAYGFLNDFNHRGAGMILDIVIMGGVYGVMILLRMPFVFRHPKWRTRMAVSTFVLLVILAIVLTFICNLARVK